MPGSPRIRVGVTDGICLEAQGSGPISDLGRVRVRKTQKLVKRG